MHDAASRLRRRQIISLLARQADSRILDLGCNDGARTMKIAEKIGASEVYGVDIVESQLEKAKQLGVKAIKADLNGRLPFEDDYFDLVHADQVIEHVAFLDNFASETRRVLKPGGTVIISTENGSSWHNIFAAILGWQIFSLTCLSVKKGGLGNPLAIHRNEARATGSWTHKTIFNYRGLREFWEAYGFRLMAVRGGAGYYPLPARIGQIDPRHSHYLTMKFRKDGH